MKRILTAGCILAASAAALPAADDGIRLPHAILRPVAEVSVTHDSNVWLSPKNPPDPVRRPVEADVFYAARLQLTVKPRADTFRAQADAWAQLQRYADTGARDTDEFGVRLQALLGQRRGLEFALYQRWAIVDFYDRGPVGRDLDEDALALADPTLESRSALSQRQLFDTGLNVGSDLTDKLTLDLRLLAAFVRYDDRSAEDGGALNDNDHYRGALEFGWKATDKTSVFLTAEGALDDSKAYDEPALQTTLRVGAASAMTEKLRFRAALGAARYQYDAGTASAPDTRASERASFELGARWQPFERWALAAIGSSGFQPAIQGAGNAIRHDAATLSVIYRVARSYYLGLGGGFRRETYLDPVEIADPGAGGGRREIEKRLDLSTASARLDYRPPGARYNLYAEWRDNHADSNDPGAEYAATRFTAGGAWRF